MIVVGLVITLAVVWVLFLAGRSWTADTSAGAAIDDLGQFIVTLLDGLTFAGLLFVVASGFTLIFGLMRTVNMAHGAFFLLAAYIAIDLQQTMVGKTRNIEPGDVSMLEWFVPLLVGALAVAVLGVVMQQLFLRWNQGQDLRQAIITIAVTVILADQMLYQYGGLAKTMVWPGDVVHFTTILGSATHGVVCSCSPSRWSSGSCSGCGSTGPAWAWSSVPASTTRTWSARSASTWPSCSASRSSWAPSSPEWGARWARPSPGWRKGPTGSGS